MPGNKPKVTIQQVADALNDPTVQGIMNRAANKLGVHRSAIKKKVDKSKKLQRIIEEWHEEILDDSEVVIRNDIARGGGNTAKWNLEMRGASRGYARESTTHHNIDNVQNPTIIILPQNDFNDEN